MNETATDFLTRCFAPGETIALLLRSESAERPVQRIVRLEQALAPAYLRWLAHENHVGANIYVAANPLRSGSRRRTKESIASVRHLYIDIDSDGEARIAALRASDSVPVAYGNLSTSPNKYQALWRVNGFDFERQESTLKLLAIAFGGDPACTDCNRVLRVPGFLNRKYSPRPSGRSRISLRFDLESRGLSSRQCRCICHAPATRNRAVNAARKAHPFGAGLGVGSARAFARKRCGEADPRSGGNAAPTSPILSTTRNAPWNMASARLWMLEGAPIDDVITMLEVRPPLRASRRTLLRSCAGDCRRRPNA